jgi:palmitoyltransferase ZDHHC9/14/18
LLFVFNTTLLCVYVFALSALQVRVKMDTLRAAGGHPSIASALMRCPAAVALMVYVFLAIIFVGGLSGFHSYLVSTNQTTYENFRYTYKSGESPYDRGCLRNWAEALCAPRLPRKVDFRAYQEDVEASPPVVDRMGRPTDQAMLPQPGCYGQPLRVETEMIGRKVPAGAAAADSRV